MKKNGIHTEFYENGKKEYEGTYSEGKKLSVEEWNEDGSAKE
jgi:antitoxin component YwqK of YwqJK toxin-antitoxin module